MQSLILMALFLFSGGNAEATRKYQVVPYEMGGSQVAFRINGTAIEEDVQLQCVIRLFNGPDSAVVEPTLTMDGQNVFCRLPPEINSGSVVVSIEATTQYTKTVLLSEDVFINAIPKTDVVVVENWNQNQLSFTWDAAYFQQFFNPGVPIIIQMTMYAAESMEPIFTSTVFSQMLGQNTGTATITVSAANMNRISNTHFPYYFVLRAVGAPNVYLDSSLIAPTLGMTNNEASRKCGLWLENAEVPEEIHPCPPCMCQVELDDNFIRTEFNPQLLRFANGSLDNFALFYERVPTSGGHAQTCSYNIETRTLATTAQASWINAVSKYTSYQDNFFEDIWPYIVCCVQSNSQQLCDLFYEKRPVDTGHLYPGVEHPAICVLDPHFVTYNNVKYDFMGHGEFWLIRGPENSGFGVQGRMAPILEWHNVSSITAVAMKNGNTTIQMELRNYESFHLLVNGVEFPITAPITIPLKDAHMIINGSVINVRLQTGFSVIVENVANWCLNVYGSGAHRNKEEGFMGLFGNFGDNDQNDLTSRDGFVIPPTAANLLDLILLHNRFGLTWMTFANESIFTYEDGKSWYDYSFPDFQHVQEYPDPATLPEEVRAVCGDSLFCFMEYIGTDDLEKAADVVRLELALDELREEIRNVERPMCAVVHSPPNGRVQVNGHFDGSTATYSCNNEYDFYSGDRTRTCFASVNESYWSGVEPVCIWTCTTCADDTDFQLSRNPNRCNEFFLCSYGERFLLECPLGSGFNSQTGACEDGFVCANDPPGC